MDLGFWILDFGFVLIVSGLFRDFCFRIFVLALFTCFCSRRPNGAKPETTRGHGDFLEGAAKDMFSLFSLGDHTGPRQFSRGCDPGSTMLKMCVCVCVYVSLVFVAFSCLFGVFLCFLSFFVF